MTLRPSRSPKVLAALLVLMLLNSFMARHLLHCAIGIPGIMVNKLECWGCDPTETNLTRQIIVSNGDDIWVDGTTIKVPANPVGNPCFYVNVLCNYGLRTDVVLHSNTWAEFQVSQNLLTWTGTKVHVKGYGTNHTFYTPYEGQWLMFYRLKFDPV